MVRRGRQDGARRRAPGAPGGAKRSSTTKTFCGSRGAQGVFSFCAVRGKLLLRRRAKGHTSMSVEAVPQRQSDAGQDAPWHTLQVEESFERLKSAPRGL